METILCVPSGRRSVSWDRISPRPLQVQHVGRRAVRFRAPDDSLATVTAPRQGLSPTGLELLNQSDFEAFAMQASATDGPVLLQTEPDLPTIDLQLAPRAGSPAAIAAMLRGLESWRLGLPTEQARLLDLGADLAVTLESDGEIGALVLSLVGAGAGATPTGDDVLVGLQAGFVLAGRADLAARLAAATLPLLGRTTLVSRSLLLAAAEGEFASYIHNLARATADATAVPAALAAAKSVGASSGLETAFAICLANHPRQRKYVA